jgi:hypothetical protein
MGDRKRGDAPFLILKYLGENGPASYGKISHDLGIPPRTVENGVMEILKKRHGLVRKLPNDKFALKWYTDEEETANTLKRKLLRNPLPEELAGLIRKSQSEAKDVLIKYLPGYREPTSDEMASSAKILFKTIILGALELPSKKELFEKGIAKLTVEGIDQETLTEILEKRTSINLDKSKSYLAEFPETRPEVIFTEEHNWIRYNVKWSYDARILLNAIDTWKQTTEMRIPRKYDKGNQSGRLSGSDLVSGLEIAELLADFYVPTEQIIGFLLRVASEPHGDLIVLATLRKYCQNALEVGQIDKRIENLLVAGLIDAAFFGFHNDLSERNEAFDIIDMLGSRGEVEEVAMDYLNECLREISCGQRDKEIFKGPDLNRIVRWLAKDPKIKKELEEKVERLIKSADYSEQVGQYAHILESIN